MNIRLTVDRGNTALKVAIWDAGNQLIASAVDTDGLCAGELARTIIPEGHHDISAIYCYVVQDFRETDIESLHTLARHVLVLDDATPVPLQVCYSTPETLGSYRLAAAVGAVCHIPGRPLLVADVGTAVTYDFVDATGRYLGGNIAPGISMRLTALHAYTSALPAVSAEGSCPVWGNSTEEALRSGTLRGVAAELSYYLRAAGPTAMAVLTGGSSPLLAAAGVLDFDYILDRCLVHKGLNRILRYNETL